MRIMRENQRGEETFRLNGKTEISYTVNKEDFGDIIKKSNLFDGACKCKVFICNDSTNNPIAATGIILLFHSVTYWDRHPQYILCKGTNVTTGILDCSNINNLKIS